MFLPRLRPVYFAVVACLAAAPVLLVAQQPQGRGNNPFPGGTNDDGSLRPSAPVTQLFTQDAYTEYAILEPGSESFRIRYIFESTRAGATEMSNATRGGSEGSGVEVYDPRTGQPVKFVYEQQGNDPESHQIRATLPRPIPQGGIGRLLIYKTYKDPRTYIMNGEDVVWVRSLSGYRLGVILPKGFAFLSSNVAAQVTTTDDGRLKIIFANPSGQSNPVTIHARKTTATFPPPSTPAVDMFFDDMKTLYDLDDAGKIHVQQIYSDYRKGAAAKLDTLSYLPLQDLAVVDLDTAETLTTAKSGNTTTVKLGVPITEDKQSAHLKLTGTISDASYRVSGDELVLERTLHGLRNTILLPAGWDVASVSQSGTIGMSQGRAFVALINLNSENEYKVRLTARRKK
jgi:hypothetical protein